MNSDEANRGVFLECGYAKGVNKQIILAAKTNCVSHYIRSLATNIIEFDNMNDLLLKIKSSDLF